MQLPARAVLFDVDGTLLDTSEFIYGGFEHALAAHGLPVPDRAALAAVIGPPLALCYQLLVPAGDLASLIASHRAWQLDNLELCRPFPGAVAVLRELRAAGLRLAAVTNRSRVSAHRSADLTGLTPYLDLLLAAEDVARQKPDPEPLLLALDRLGVAASEAVMVGDTYADILAGRAASVRTVGVTHGFHGTAVAEHAPDALIDSLGELLALVLPAAD